MKRNFSIFVLISFLAFVLAGCANKFNPFEDAAAKYSGEYIVKDMTAGGDTIYDLFDTGNTSYGLFYQYDRKASAEGISRLGTMTVSVNAQNGSVNASLIFVMQYLSTASLPPYSIDTPVSFATDIESYVQQFAGTVQENGEIIWSKGIFDKDEYRLHRVLLGAGTITRFDGKVMDLRFEEFPVYDYTSQKTFVIPITYHLERE